jgi:hypothetical protein
VDLVVRRRQTPSAAVPEPLARYVASEWPGGINDWMDAALAWLNEDETRRLPIGQHGDQIDVIRESARIKIGHHGDVIHRPHFPNRFS